MPCRTDRQGRQTGRGRSSAIGSIGRTAPVEWRIELSRERFDIRFRFVIEIRDRDVSAKKEDQIAALEAHLGRMRELEKLAKNFAKVGQGSAHDAFAAEYYRADAELQLLRAKAK